MKVIYEVYFEEMYYDPDCNECHKRSEEHFFRNKDAAINYMHERAKESKRKMKYYHVNNRLCGVSFKQITDMGYNNGLSRRQLDRMYKCAYHDEHIIRLRNENGIELATDAYDRWIVKKIILK